MATVNFYLKEPNSDRETLILVKYNSGNLRFKLSTGERIHPDKWNEKTQRAKKNYSGASDLNDLLKSMEAEVNRIRRDAIASGVPLNADHFKKEFSLFLQKEPKEKKISLVEALDEFMKVKKDKLSFNYLRSVNAMKNHLIAYAKEQKVKMTFESINLSFYDSFTSYLYAKGQTNNTVGTNINRLKRFLDWASMMGYNSTTGYKEKGFRAMEDDELEVIYLTEEELFRIFTLDLCDSQRLYNVREAFCFQCFTGLRFSDIEELQPDDVKGDELTITTRKTRDLITVPLNNYALEILQRNSFRLNTISNQKTNDYLKEIGQRAELNEVFEIVRFRGSVRIPEKFKKYQLLSTHTARRTFITLSLEKGMRPEVVMKITGHRSMKNFMRYVKITDKVKKIELQRVWNRQPEPVLKAV